MATGCSVSGLICEGGVLDGVVASLEGDIEKGSSTSGRAFLFLGLLDDF